MQYFEEWELHSKHPHILLFSQLTILLGIISHWLSCLYVIVSQWEGLYCVLYVYNK